MNLYLRTLLVFLSSFFKETIRDILEPSILRLRVFPNDLDFNGHMNNGRYLTIMDLGRFDLVLRTGLMKLMLRQKSVPILASAKIRYRQPLLPFQPYDLETRIICWDEKWAYLEQRFVIVDGPKKGAVAAIAIVKGSFFDKRAGKTVPTCDLMQAIGHDKPSPEFPSHIRKWQEAEEALRDITRSE